MEFGVGGGTTLRMISEVLPAIGFDSFEGLPEHWRDGFPQGMFAGKPILDMPGTTVLPGLFEDTLPDFDWPDDLSLVHIDCDLYSSTATVLKHIGPALQPGCIVVFDEFFGYEGCELHEQKAWAEFLAETSVIAEVIGHGREQVAFRILAGAA